MIKFFLTILVIILGPIILEPICFIDKIGLPLYLVSCFIWGFYAEEIVALLTKNVL